MAGRWLGIGCCISERHDQDRVDALGDVKDFLDLLCVEITHNAGSYAQFLGLEHHVREDDGDVYLTVCPVLATLADSLVVVAEYETLGCAIQAGGDGVERGDRLGGGRYINLLRL